MPLLVLLYNVGVGALGSSTLLKKHNAGDYEAAQNEFLNGIKLLVKN